MCARPLRVIWCELRSRRAHRPLPICDRLKVTVLHITIPYWFIDEEVRLDMTSFSSL